MTRIIIIHRITCRISMRIKMLFRFGLFGSILSFTPDSGDFWSPENQDSKKLSDAFEALLRPLFDSGKDLEIFIVWQVLY